MEDGMERKFPYGIWKMPEWNAIKGFKNGWMTIFHTFNIHSILYFAQGIYRKFLRIVITKL